MSTDDSDRLARFLEVLRRDSSRGVGRGLRRFGRMLRGLGAGPSADDAAYAHVRRLLRSFFGPLLDAGPRAIDGRIVVDMGQITSDKLALARLRLPGRLMFLFRIRFGLYAVLSRLGSVCDWAAMERRFAGGG